MALYTIAIYPTSDFLLIDFGDSTTPGQLTTGPTVNQIALVIDDDDTLFGNSDPAPPTVTSAPSGFGISPGDAVIYTGSWSTELTTAAGENFVEITVGGTPFIAFFNAGTPVQPNTTYAEVDPNSVLTNSSYSFWAPVCFGQGTMIRTAAGDRAIETLSPGDCVLTETGRAAPIRWIAQRRISALEQAINPALRPVRIAKGALGPGMPARDLTLSQQHRVLLRSPIVARMTGSASVLVPAKKLTGHPGIAVAAPQPDLCYFHMLLDRHDVVISNGAPTESLLLGDQALASLTPHHRADLSARTSVAAESPAHPILDQGRRVARLLDRHRANALPLVSAPQGDGEGDGEGDGAGANEKGPAQWRGLSEMVSEPLT
ncbi:MAG: Hint domain-containing protein [Pseudomonadota bacterium]